MTSQVSASILKFPLAEQGAEDDECDAAMNVVFFAAPLPQVVKLA